MSTETPGTGPDGRTDPDLLAGYDSARRNYGDSYADYLIKHDQELLAKGWPLTAWPHSLQGNDGD